MTGRRLRRPLTILIVGLGCLCSARAADEALPGGDVLMRALVDELNRSLDLQIEDLEQPYFIQYAVDDALQYQLSAEYGSITGADRNRSRRFQCQVRVGTAELDNTNFAGGGGGMRMFGRRGGGGRTTSLPVDDDYLAIRQAIWQATDADYKSAVETLTRKRAYLRDKNIADRPADFSMAAPVEKVEPPAVLQFDENAWQENLKRISARFKDYEQIQDSSVQLMVGAENAYVVNSEGTRLCVPDSGALLVVSAQAQAEDGMRLADSRTYTGRSTGDFPPIDQIIADVDALVSELTAVMQADTIEYYAGPVLFDGLSSAQMFRAMLAGGVVGKPDPVGERRRRFQAGASLESKLGARVLPRPFQVWDDPTIEEYGGKVLLGDYAFDDEGVPAQRVDIVTNGRLENMCLSRAPTSKLSGSNGHARRAGGGGTPEAAIGCLFIQDDDGVSDEELKAALIEAAQDSGLEYGVRIKSIRSAGITSSPSDLISMFMRGRRGGGGPTLGDPVVAYKVYVADGHEEPFRGCEFAPLQVSDLKDIVAAGDTPEVYNYIGVGMGGTAPAASIIAPPVLFEDLELAETQQEHDKLPILKAPAAR